MRPDPESFVSLSDHACLRLLETPCLYDRKNDELYELNREGLEALQKCRGHLRLSEVDLEKDFLQTCLEEGLLTLTALPCPKPLALRPSPIPSLLIWNCRLHGVATWPAVIVIWDRPARWICR